MSWGSYAPKIASYFADLHRTNYFRVQKEKGGATLPPREPRYDKDKQKTIGQLYYSITIKARELLQLKTDMSCTLGRRTCTIDSDVGMSERGFVCQLQGVH